MPAIDGIASGIDTSAIIDSLVAAQSTTKSLMQRDLAGEESKLARVGEFKTKLTTIADTLKALDAEDEFGEYTASLSDEGYFSVSTDSEAIAGTYSITVNALAASEVTSSQGFADADLEGALATGTFSVTYDGEQSDITLDATSTLSDLALELDAVDGLQAYVMNTGDASTPYRLVVMGENTGADYGITFDTSGLTGTTIPIMTEQVTASDAEAEINGITVYSASNSMDSAIPGVELDLEQVSSAAVSLTINRDDDAIADKVQEFVDAYNDVRSFYGVQTNFDSDNGVKGAFFGDSTLRNIVSKLSDIMTTASSLTGDYTTFNEVGIESGQSGRLTFDRTAFEDALEANYDDAMAVFTDDDGPAQSMIDQLDDYYLADDGLIETKSDTIEDNIEDLEDAITDFEDRLTSYESRLRSQFTAMEVALGRMQTTQGFLSNLLTQS
jgi:flagellar hook-associated protein 2